jgi:hypothetical protein
VLYNLLAKIFKWKIREEKKPVFKSSKKRRLVRCILYVLPVGTCIVLIFFNFFNYYIGGELSGTEGEDTEKLYALQFAAKIHELLMIASLGSILVTIIRRELSVKEGLPFGALFSPQQIQSIDILWSPEFWGIVRRSYKSKKIRWWLIVLYIAVFSILGLSVGPSSAVLMRPRLQYWNAGGTPFWIGGKEANLFPSTIQDQPALSWCSMDGVHASCPSAGWEIINQDLLSFWPQATSEFMLPEQTRLDSKNSIRDLRITTRTNGNTIFRNAYTTATVPMTFIADSVTELSRLWYLAASGASNFHLIYRKDVALLANALQPMVTTRCTRYDDLNTTNRGFPILKNIYLQGGDSPDDALSGINGTVPDSTPGLATEINDFVSQAIVNSKPALFWVDNSTLLDQMGATLAVAAFIPAAGSLPDLRYYCSLDSRFLNETVYTNRTMVKVAQSNAYTGLGTVGTNYPKIYPAATWARYLNPVMQDSNSTAFSVMATTSGLWSTTNLPSSFLKNTEPALEQILSALLANGISRSNYNYTWMGNQPDEKSGNILSHSGRIGHGGNIFNISDTEQANSTKFDVVALVNGYAYATEGKAQKAALAVLMVYSLIIIFYMSILLCMKLPTTSSWGRPSEIAALAINSERALELRNTGAGIATVSVFENKISITAKEGDLQMVFGDTPKGSAIQPDREYG